MLAERSPNSPHPLVIRLWALHENSEKYKTSVGSNARATLAILRRGMKDRLSQVDTIPMFTALSTEFFIGNERAELWCMVIASLYSYAHKSIKQTSNISLGRALQELARQSQSGSLEMRVMAMLKSDAEHLPGHLRQLVSLLEAKEIGLDWNLLLLHLFDWDHPDRYVQKWIVRDYYTEPFHSTSIPLDNETDNANTRRNEGE